MSAIPQPTTPSAAPARFASIVRPYSPREVERLRGSTEYRALLRKKRLSPP